MEELLSKANNEYNNGKIQEAIALYTQALSYEFEEKMDKAAIYFRRARAEASKDDFDSLHIIEDCSYATENGLKTATIYHLRGSHFMKYGFYKEAIEDFKVVLSMQGIADADIHGNSQILVEQSISKKKGC